MASDDVLELSTIWDITGADGEVANVIHYRQTKFDGTSSQSSLGNSLSSLVIDIFEADLLPDLSDQITLERIDWFYVTDPVFGGSQASAQAGGQLDELVSLRSAPVIKKITGLRGRSFQGRLFLPPVTENDQTRGILNTAIKDIFQTTLDNLRVVQDFGNLNNWTMTVFSRALSTPPSVVVDNTVSSYVINPNMGSIRGRQAVT